MRRLVGRRCTACASVGREHVHSQVSGAQRVRRIYLHTLTVAASVYLPCRKQSVFGFFAISVPSISRMSSPSGWSVSRCPSSALSLPVPCWLPPTPHPSALHARACSFPCDSAPAFIPPHRNAPRVLRGLNLMSGKSVVTIRAVASAHISGSFPCPAHSCGPLVTYCVCPQGCERPDERQARRRHHQGRCFSTHSRLLHLPCPLMWPSHHLLRVAVG